MARPPDATSRRALRAHLCRCTGWQSIVEAACDALGIGETPADAGRRGRATRCSPPGGPRSRAPPSRSRGPTSSSAAGASRTTPHHPARWSQLGADAPLAPDLRAARAAHGRVQGRNSTVPLTHPVELPAGDWALTLQTTWVEPAYVEPDASWCRPGGRPAPPLANGGAFGGKARSPVPARARALADQSGDGRPGPVAPRGRRAARPQAPAARPRAAPRRLRASSGWPPRRARPTWSPWWRGWARCCPGCTSSRSRSPGRRWRPSCAAPGWAEVLAARQALEAPAAAAGHRPGPRRAARRGERRRRGPPRDDGERGRIEVDVWAGEILCPVTLRSYALGAVHQALGLVWSEGIAVDGRGRAGRPDHPLLRHPGRPRHARGRRPAPRGGGVGPSTAPTPCSSPPWPRPGWPTASRALADPPRRRACALRGTWHHRAVERSPMSPAVGPYSPFAASATGSITSGQIGLAHRRLGRGRRSSPGGHGGRVAPGAPERWPRCSPSRARPCPTWSRPRCS